MQILCFLHPVPPVPLIFLIHGFFFVSIAAFPGEAPRVMAFEALEVPQLSEAKRGVIRSYQFRGGSEPAARED